MSLVKEAKDNGLVSGKFMDLALSIERKLAEIKRKPVPMNIDGATAVIFAELGFAPPLARGLFCLSRSVGACLLYTSPSPRDVEESRMPSSA